MILINIFYPIIFFFIVKNVVLLIFQTCNKTLKVKARQNRGYMSYMRRYMRGYMGYTGCMRGYTGCMRGCTGCMRGNTGCMRGIICCNRSYISWITRYNAA